MKKGKKKQTKKYSNNKSYTPSVKPTTVIKQSVAPEKKQELPVEKKNYERKEENKSYKKDCKSSYRKPDNSSYKPKVKTANKRAPIKKVTPEEAAAQCYVDLKEISDLIQKITTEETNNSGINVEHCYRDMSKMEKGSVSVDITLALPEKKSEKDITVCVTRDQRIDPKTRERIFHIIIVGGENGRRKILFVYSGVKANAKEKIEKYLPSIFATTKVILEKIK